MIPHWAVKGNIVAAVSGSYRGMTAVVTGVEFRMSGSQPNVTTVWLSAGTDPKEDIIDTIYLTNNSALEPFWAKEWETVPQPAFVRVTRYEHILRELE